MKTILTVASVLALTSAANAETFTYTGAAVSFTVPVAGTYRIIAFGAQGGDAVPPVSAGKGGLGAEIAGDVALHQGDQLTIAVAGAGTSGNPGTAGGGGGGSFVVGPDNTPLVIAGGGGGGGLAGVPGATSIDGGPGLVTNDGGSVPPNNGGTNGSGGASDGSGGGGGGFAGSGQGLSGTGGGGWPGLAGGTPLNNAGAGGFGGGGGAAAGLAGGGGGYSGGAPPPPFGEIGHAGGAGGGSFDAGANPLLASGVQAGNGLVMITFLAPLFAGTAGQPNCFGQSVAALASIGGGLPAAAQALNFANVGALQAAISLFCK